MKHTHRIIQSAIIYLNFEKYAYPGYVTVRLRIYYPVGFREGSDSPRGIPGFPFRTLPPTAHRAPRAAQNLGTPEPMPWWERKRSGVTRPRWPETYVRQN